MADKSFGLRQLNLVGVGTPSIESSTDLVVNTNGSERVRIDSSGNVGIGTTNASVAVHIANSAPQLRLEDTDTNGYAAVLSDNNGSIYLDADGGNTQSNSSIRFRIDGGNEKARIDSSGRLLVNTTSELSPDTNAFIHTAGATAGNIILANKQTGALSGGGSVGAVRFFSQAGGGGYEEHARIACQAGGTTSSGNKPGNLVFFTTPSGSSSVTQRMKLSSAGRLDVFSGSATDTTILSSAASAGGSIELISGRHSASGTGVGTKSFLVFTNGNVQNTNNSYGSTSDIKLKENIVDASSQWDDLKAIQVRKYNFKEETGHQTHTQLGVIAQEVELVSPGLVTESPDRDEEGNDLGTTTKSVNYSVLYMKAVKALQEAQTRIETLEAKVAALETP